MIETLPAVESLRPLYLMVEDNPQDAEIFAAMLRKATIGNSKILWLTNMEDALETLQLMRFDALILDLRLSGESGLGNIRLLTEANPQTPIVVLTSHNDANIATQSLQAGAQDFLCKEEVTPPLLLRSLRYATERKKIEMQLKAALQESSERNRQLSEMAHRDALTGLLNRVAFLHVAERGDRAGTPKP